MAIMGSWILSEIRKGGYLLTALCDKPIRCKGRAISINPPYSPSTLWDCRRKTTDPASGQGLP